MAMTIASKIYPDIGWYKTAGVTPADQLNPHMLKFMQSRGINFTGMRPRQLDTSRESLAQYHVIVGMHKKVIKGIVKIPFRTSALNWKGLKIPQTEDQQEWEALHKTLALHVKELLNLLHGDEAI
jgi:protein-tyrosine-phosphatase